MLISFALGVALAQALDGRELVVNAREVEELPRIDGVLSEPLWQSATVVTGFVQSEPQVGEPATERTEVRIAYTRDILLIGARLFDIEPERLVGTEYRRDALLESEDSFEIFLDTFRDGRNAFYFATNPVGTRLDGVMRNEGAVQNFEWDGVWQVASTKDEGGWTAEIAIPFNTLRFIPGSSEGWGLNFGRRVARKREESYWAFITPDWGFNAKFRASRYGQLTGIERVRPGGRRKLKPYILFNDGSVLFGGWEYNAEGLTEPFEIRDDIEIPVGEYHFNRFNANFTFDQSRRIAPSVLYSDGAFYNGTLRSISLGVEAKPHNRVRVNAFYSRNDVSLPVEGAVRQMGAVDVLINNAGISIRPRSSTSPQTCRPTPPRS